MGGGLTHRPHKINHPAASLITSLPCLLQPQAPSPIGGRILGTQTELLSHFLSGSWALGDPEGQAAILWLLSLPCCHVGSQLRKGEALTLACVPTSCWSYWFHQPASTPKQSWGLGKSKKGAVDLLALERMGLLCSQAPLTILVGL